MLPPPDAGFRLLGNRRGSIDEVRLRLHEDAAVGCLTESDGGAADAVEVLRDQLERGAGQERRASRGCIIPSCCKQRFCHFAIGLELERTAGSTGGHGWP